jgi:hypothetical protein
MAGKGNPAVGCICGYGLLLVSYLHSLAFPSPYQWISTTATGFTEPKFGTITSWRFGGHGTLLVS